MKSEDTANIFKRAGIIRHISMPKFKDGQPKGFSFVEFATPDTAQNACRMFNNSAPEEFTNYACVNYIKRNNTTQSIS